MVRPIKNKDGHNKILATARKILTRQGVAEVTARNVAKTSGYGLGSIYSYFENFDDLILQINSQTLAELHEELSRLNNELPNNNSKLIKICHGFFDFAHKNKELWASVTNYQRSGKEKSAAAYQDQVDNLTHLVEEIIQPFLKTGQKKAEMALLLWSGLQGIWYITMRPNAGFKTLNPEQAKKMVEILVKNLFK